MTTDLAAISQLRNIPDLPEHEREAAEAVASDLRDARADNTTGLARPGCHESRDRPTPAGAQYCAPPQAAALYLIHQAAPDRTISSAVPSALRREAKPDQGRGLGSPGRHDTLTYSRIPRNGVTTIPAVVSVLITDEAVEAAPQGDVLFIQYNPGEEFSPADVGADGSPV